MNATCSMDRCDTCPGSSLSGRVVCRCLQVTEDDVVSTIVSLGLRTVKEVRQATGAGTGCMCCHDEIRKQLQLANSLAIAG